MEVIVVLVILAILSALLIPALTGYIDKANDRTLMAETREAVLAMQTITTEAYGLGGETIPGDMTTAKNGQYAELYQEAVTLAEVPGEIVYATQSGGKITELLYRRTRDNKELLYQNGFYGTDSRQVVMSQIVSALPSVQDTIIPYFSTKNNGDTLDSAAYSFYSKKGSEITYSTAHAVVDALRAALYNGDTGTELGTEFRILFSRNLKNNPDEFFIDFYTPGDSVAGSKVEVTRYAFTITNGDTKTLEVQKDPVSTYEGTLIENTTSQLKGENGNTSFLVLAK